MPRPAGALRRGRRQGCVHRRRVERAPGRPEMDHRTVRGHDAQGPRRVHPVGRDRARQDGVRDACLSAGAGGRRPEVAVHERDRAWRAAHPGLPARTGDLAP